MVKDVRRALIVSVLMGLGLSAPAGSAAAPPLMYGHARMWHGLRIAPVEQPGQPVPGARAAAASASSPSAGTGSDHTDQVLSNERTFTRWAYTARIAPIYRAAGTSSRRIARLRWDTEDGFAENYLLLGSHWDAGGREWVEIRVPMRPNGTTGWVQRKDLGRFHLTRLHIVVNRARMRMSLFSDGHLRWHAPVGVGKPGTPTPPGHFWIREIFKILNAGSGYWPYAFGTSDYSRLTDWPGGGVVGIHGPYFDPAGIPGRISHGCIRLRVAADRWLAAHVGVGTPLTVI